MGEDGYESRSQNSWCAGRTLTGRVLVTVAAGQVAFRLRSFSPRESRDDERQRLPAARGRHPPRRARLRRTTGAVTGEVVFNTAMTGYQESVTDPSYAGQIIVFTYPLIGNYGVSAAAMESDRVHARGVVMRDAKNREDVASAEGGWLDWLGDCGVPGDQRRRHPRPGPPHPRPRRDARRHLPGRDARGRGARTDRRRALDGRRRPRPHRHPAGAGPLRRRRPARGRDRHRGQAEHRPPAARARLPS